jgi:hypothetical protein
MSLNVFPRRRARLAFSLPLLLGMPALAAAQPVILADGDFAQWTTAAVTADQVQGARDGQFGEPAPGYRIEHVHTSATSGGFGVGSRSAYNGASFDFSSFDAADALDIHFDLCVAEPDPPGPLPLEVTVTPVLLQGEAIFRSTRLVTQVANTEICIQGRFRRHLREVPLRDFVAAGGGRLDLAAGAPRVRVALLVQTIWPALGTVRAWLDNLRVRHLPAAGLPVTMSLTDRNQAWGNELDETILYELRVENDGPPQSGLVVEMRIPGNSCFLREGSSAGWACDSSAPLLCSLSGERVCTFRLQQLPTGGQRDLTFAVSLMTGIPEAWEFLAEARLLSATGSELSADEEITPPVALTGPGCLCLFFPGLCTG